MYLLISVKIGNIYIYIYEGLGIAESIEVKPMTDVTDLQDQIYLKQGKLLFLIEFSGLEIFKGVHAVWNFKLLGQ